MLVPRDSASCDQLSKDYDEMKDMIYGEIPEFETILEWLLSLEKEMNSELDNK